MKKLLTAALLFLAVNCQAVTYYQVQHGANIVKKSTTTFVNTWELRGNIEVGVDTYTVTLDNVAKNVVIYGTGTVRALRVEGNGAALTSLTPANMLAGSLPSTVIASSIAVNAVGVPQIKATGSPTAATFLAGDGSWDTPSGAGDAVLAATQTWTGGNTFSGTIGTGGKTWQIIYSTTIYTAVSSHTITGLNGNADVMYRLESCFTGTVGTDYAFYFNGDTGATAYWGNFIYFNGTAVGASRGTRGNIHFGSGDVYPNNVTATIHARITAATPTVSVNYSGGASTTFSVVGTGWYTAGTNITSITVCTLAPTTFVGDLTLWALR